MATVVYNYFSENFGYVNNHNDVQYQRKYESFSTKYLKKIIKKIKIRKRRYLGDQVRRKESAQHS